MNCKVCGASEFSTNAGITYCTECNSQIQETQTESNVDPVSSTSLLSSPSVKKTARDRRKEYGNWITAECFNHIIFMQVSTLIKLGASPNLKKTVLHIWSKYLQKCEIAFRTDFNAQESTPCLGPVPLKRDIKVLYGKERISNRKRRNSERSSLSGVTSEEDSSASDTEYTSDASSSISSEVNRVKKKYSSHARKLLKKSSVKVSNKTKLQKRVIDMSLPKTLSLCYLGLLYTEDQLALHDLIRFAYEDKLPYLNIIDKLPSSLKLKDADTNTFLVYTVPDAYSIVKVAHEIAEFLKLPKFKKPSVFLAISRFVKDLNLPDDIKPVVKVLVEQYKEQTSKWKNDYFKNVSCDYQAVAFIVVALKMLFILDDKFEIEHSKVMNKLNAIHPGHKYFVWKEWKEQSVLKEYLFLVKTPGYSAINKLDGLSADKIISKNSFTHLKSLTEEDMQNPRNPLVIRNKVKTLLSNLVNIPNRSESIVTSFPLRSEINRFVEEWRSLPMFKETQEIDFTLLQKDFSSHSLSFNPSQFNKVDDELSYLLMTSLYSPDFSVDIFSHSFTSFQQIITTTSKYWFFKFVKSGSSDFSSDWFDKLPASFKWLINFLCKYAYCNNVCLYRDISHIEKVLFLQRKRVCSQKLFV